MSSAKIFIYRPHNQFTNQITLLCDGNDHCKYRINVAKPVCGNQMKPTTLTISVAMAQGNQKQVLIFFQTGKIFVINIKLFYLFKKLKKTIGANFLKNIKTFMIQSRTGGHFISFNLSSVIRHRAAKERIIQIRDYPQSNCCA